MAEQKPWWQRKGGWQCVGSLHYKNKVGVYGCLFINSDKKAKEYRFAEGEDCPNPTSRVFQRASDAVSFIFTDLGYQVEMDAICAKHNK